MSAPRKPLVAFLRDCNVRYEGRAEAVQRGGDLTVLVKEDGTVVAHTMDEGVSPQFYNPAGDTSVWIRRDRLYVRGISADGERLSLNGLPVWFEELHEVAGGTKPQRTYVGGREEHIARWIRVNPPLEDLRGVDVKREETRTGGRVDLSYENGIVAEVKKSANISAYDQARRYLRDEDVESVVIFCFDASENLMETCDGDPEIQLVSLEESEFEEWLEAS